MKILLVVATLFLAFGAIESRLSLEQLKNMVMSMRKYCVPKVGVSEEVLEAANNGYFPPDPALQCYYKCIFQRMKVMKNDKLLFDAMIKQLDAMVNLDILDKMKYATLNCKSAIDSEDACVLSWQFVKCYYETDNTVIFFP